MAKVRDVCRHVRSKNAGPFWVTIDLFFDGADNFAKYSMSESLSPELFERLYGTNPVSGVNEYKLYLTDGVLVFLAVAFCIAAGFLIRLRLRPAFQHASRQPQSY